MKNLNINSLVSKALRVAAKAHKDGVRKGKEIPYIVHPVEVAMTLQKYGMREELIVAGLLHDTLEDTDVTAEELRAEFNDEIAELVLRASEKLEDRDNTPWEERKEHTVNYLRNAPQDIKYISCADKLSNIRSMVRDYEEIGNKLWERFNRGYEDQKWYYENLVESLRNFEGKEMYEQFKLAVEYLFKDNMKR